MKLNKEQIKSAIQSAQSESDALVEIYKMVYPEWDDIVSVDKYPAVNQATWKAICNMFMDLTSRLNKSRPFDKQVFPGGIWLNNGFTTGNCEDWEVSKGAATMKETVLS